MTNNEKCYLYKLIKTYCLLFQIKNQRIPKKEIVDRIDRFLDKFERKENKND